MFLIEFKNKFFNLSGNYTFFCGSKANDGYYLNQDVQGCRKITI